MTKATGRPRGRRPNLPRPDYMQLLKTSRAASQTPTDEGPQPKARVGRNRCQQTPLAAVHDVEPSNLGPRGFLSPYDSDFVSNDDSQDSQDDCATDCDDADSGSEGAGADVAQDLADWDVDAEVASESTVTVVIDDDVRGEVKGACIQGAQAFAGFLEEHSVELDASRQDHLAEIKKLHNSSVRAVEVCAELGTAMSDYCTILKSQIEVLDESLVEAMEKGYCHSKGVELIQQDMRQRPLHKMRDLLRSAAKGYLGRVYAFTFSMRGICGHVSSSSPVHTVRLRDPIVLIHDMLNGEDVLSSDETLHVFANPRPAVLAEFCDNERSLEMQNMVRERARRAAHADPKTWEAVDIDTELATLPIGVYMDATHATKTGSVVKCPIVVFTYWHSRDTLQRNGAKRILGYVELPAKGRQTNWRAAYERAKEQCVLEAVFHIVSAWQSLAFKRGGLAFKVAGGREVRVVPVLAAILGDNKEPNRLSCTFETTRCRMCSADRAVFQNGMAMPMQSPRNLETMKKHWSQVPSLADFGPRFGVHKNHAGARNALLTTKMDFFAQPTSIYPMFPFDRLHTLWKGPVSELVIAVLCSAQRERKAFLSQIKLCKSSMPPALTVTTERLQGYLAAAGNFPADALQRPKYNAKDYVHLTRGVLSAYIHDVLVGKAANSGKINLRDEFRVLIWALAAAARVCHEFSRQRIAVEAIPALRRDVGILVDLQQRYRIIFERPNITTQKAHGVLHMVDHIAMYGPLDLTDTASFERHHAKVTRQSKLVNHGTDVNDTCMLRRAIEHESARNRPGAKPLSRPRANLRARVVGGAAGKPDQVAEPARSLGRHVDDENLESQTAPCAKVARSLAETATLAGGAATPGSSLADLLRARLESAFGQTDTIEVYTKADLAGSKRQLALGAASTGKWAKLPPSVLITEERELFLPLAFVRKKQPSDTEPATAKVLAIRIAHDPVSHAVLSRHTYRGKPLSGFCIVDLAAATQGICARNIAMLDLDKVGGGETFWLNPEDARDRRAILWPHGTLAFGRWRAHPFAYQPRQAGSPERMGIAEDDVDDTVDFEKALAKLKARLDPETDRLPNVARGKAKRQRVDDPE